MLHLSYLRSSQVVAQAVAARFPEYDEWLGFLSTDVARDTLDAVAQLVFHVQGSFTEPTRVDFEQLQQVGAVHLEDGLAAVSDLAAELEVPAQDLLTTLLYG